MESKIQRCEARAAKDEILTAKEWEKKIRSIDKNRAHVRELLSGSDWGNPKAYHLTINTSNWAIESIVPALAECVNKFFI